MGLRSSVGDILRYRWVSVGDIFKEVTDTFSIVGSSDSLGKHHTHVNYLEKSQSNLIQIPNIKNVIARMYGPRKKKSIIFLPVSSHTQSCSYPAFKTNQSSSQRKERKNLRDCVCHHNSFKGAVVQPVQCFPAEFTRR